MAKRRQLQSSGPGAVLREKLLKLEATKNGFEGVIGRLISAATSDQLRLMSSGDQQGVDAVTDQSKSVLRRAMQAKKYNSKTGFDVNALLGEMDRAERAFSDIDCWIMATTKPFHGKEAESLENHARALGWSFVSLDWSGAGGIPRLAALCAAFPEATLAFAPGTDVEIALKELSEDSSFAPVRDLVLAQLRSDEASFVSAAKHSHKQLLALYTDAAAARQIAGPSPALLAEAPPVDRPKLIAQLDSWWQGTTQTVALLGSEGVGKTWTGLQYLRHLSSGTASPLIVIVKATRADKCSDGFEAILDALELMFREVNTRIAEPRRFWRRRLERWAASQEKAVRLLVMVDGLDELDPFDWSGWLAPLLRKENERLYRLLLACRSDDWNHRVDLTENYSAKIVTQAIGKFEPAERDNYLRSRGIDIANVSRKVMDAALHPRTAFHLTRMAKDLPNLASITREQLLLRDFQNRHAVKGGVLTAETFKSLVEGLARKAQDAALSQRAFATSAGAVTEMASDLSGYDKSRMRSVLSDLLSSSWIRRDVKDANKLEFEDSGLPDAVGMALAADIIGHPPATAMSQVERFLEPWGADDILEPVLRTCATALLIDTSVSDDLCTMILKRWFGVPFHNAAGQDFWRRLHVFRPRVFLDFAVVHGGRAHNWLIEWGIACLWEDHAHVREEIEERLRDWLVEVPIPEYRHHQNSDVANLFNRDARIQLKRLAVLMRNGEADWQKTIGQLELSERQRLPRMAVRTMSFLPRVPFLAILEKWAVACAGAGRRVSSEAVEALVRHNDIDHDLLVRELRIRSKALTTTRSAGIGRRSASILLNLTGLPEDAAEAQSIFRSREHAIPSAIEVRDNTIDVRRGDATEKSFLLAQLTPWAPHFEKCLSDTLKATVAPEVRTALTDISAVFRRGENVGVLAHWFKDELAVAVKSFLSNPPPVGGSDRGALADYCRVAIAALPALSRAERKDLGEKLANFSVEDGSSLAAVYQLSSLDSESQIKLLLSLPLNQWPKHFEHLLLTPESAVVQALIRSIDVTRGDDKEFGKLYLAAHLASRNGVTGVYAQLDWKAGFQHSEERFVAKVLELAVLAGGQASAQILADMGWDASAVSNPEINWYGSEVLALLDDASLIPLLERLRNDTVLRLYYARPSIRGFTSDIILKWFKDVLLIPRASHSMGGRHYYYNKRDVHYDCFYRDNADAIDDMLREAWADKALKRNITFSDGISPAWFLLRCAASRNPDFVAEIWRGAIADNRHTWIGNLEVFPAALPKSSQADTMRSEMLRRADDDNKLFSACMRLQACGHQDALIAEAMALWSASRAVDRAKALAIAGFATNWSAATDFWDHIQMPTAGWLREVHSNARGFFENIVNTRLWASDLASTAYPVQAWCDYTLLEKVYDERLHLEKRSFQVEPSSWNAKWLDFFFDRRERLRDEFRKKLDKTYCLSPKTTDYVYSG